ncbi:MAG: PLP-dependent aspartate aminotransferase family protein [Hoeflea sp.]|uniref:trans-sulfuration enzyme family protein n=1 Tax=Hoeflea sp. TaxID=1940281 RepID=UPI001DF00532|nr:PLP-dependent aspartate aminotransferase family protein [Hoeflea sp.]MBU4529857.1 PLP-dependent aspartate aminotransferase family protein [Alphaproteobacteria bacterium]MBU4547122.1 PLP-dependent aspartate aminotransferase family protein [Alphaproteobacteria bacterium]MBU4548735.1 PLP-dependent aspartate aminotransferase family protein [Alphaproteobacteria bacterium]MBV1722350.1 PLP-dependent aspartate aminotransferase family protein [Hoeflea sp.]MBV1762493.1 PLP-dependent aspartate aminotr
MTLPNDLKPSTIAAQAGGVIDWPSGGVVPPMQPSTTFVRDEDYALVNPDNIYSRDNSDIVRITENVLARLEGAEEALLFPSGMAAIAALVRTLPNGATIVVQSGIYWGTTKWLRDFCARRKIGLHEVDASDAGALEAACAAHKPDLLFIETPSNPWLKTVDIAHAANCAHKAGGLLAVDSTAATPVLQRPLELGCDVVMHSATKGINGHSDVLAGVLATSAPAAKTWTDIKADRHDAGAVIGPFEAWLLLRGMRTLPLRVERMSRSAQAIAEYLSAHPKVTDVYYPGLESHPGHDIAARQMQGGFGCLMSFLVEGGAAEALKVVGKLKLFHRATSLGGVESLVEHRHTIEPHTGIPPSLIRVSVGIEDAGDLIADLEQALG